VARIIGGANSGWKPAAAVNKPLSLRKDASVQTDKYVTAAHDSAKRTDKAAALAYDSLAQVDGFYRLNTLNDFDRHFTQVLTITDGFEKVDNPEQKVTWDNDLSAKDAAANTPYWRVLPTKDRADTAHYHSVYKYREKPVREVYEYYLPTFNLAFGAPLAKLTFSFDDPTGFEPKTLPMPVGHDSDSRWQSTKHVDFDTLIPWGWSKNRAITGGPYKTVFLVPEPDDPTDPTDPTDPNEPGEPPTLQRSYTVVNVVNLVSLPDLTPIPFENCSLSRDIDTTSWTLNATLKTQSAVDLVSPRTGAFKEVRLTINGDIWEFFVSKVSQTTSFGKKAWQVTAYSRSKLLSAPYSSKGARVEVSQSTAAQIATDELFGTGFTINWPASIDWSIPANVFSYSDKSSIDAIGMLTTAVGAVIEPHPANLEISIKPRFEHSAWNWSSATEDRTIPRALFESWTEEYQPQASYNAVYVSGQEYGVVAKVVQMGTAGDQLMGDVSDPLLTDQIANAERGRIELSKAGHKEVFSGKIFYDSQESFVNIGELVKVVSTDGTWFKGVVTSTNIEVNRMGAVAYQNLQILRHFD
jgi:hypothetical protein